MTDLDERIRERLRYPDRTNPNAEPNALRKVLEWCRETEDLPWYGGAALEIREDIARELGVSDDA